MKKLFIFIIVALLFSCDLPQKKATPSVVEFQYKGHTYLRMFIPGDSNSTIVHDPDCKKCLNYYD